MANYEKPIKKIRPETYEGYRSKRICNILRQSMLERDADENQENDFQGINKEVYSEIEILDEGIACRNFIPSRGLCRILKNPNKSDFEEDYGYCPYTSEVPANYIISEERESFNLEKKIKETIQAIMITVLITLPIPLGMYAIYETVKENREKLKQKGSTVKVIDEKENNYLKIESDLKY